MPARLPRSFFARPTPTVARELLGCRLARRIDGRRVSGLIVEVEAYVGEADQACHGRAGRTPRTEAMFGRPGAAYVYFTYGLHWMFNVVTGRAGFPAAVLIRALEPIEGVDVMRQNRPQTAGPRRASRAQPDWASSRLRGEVVRLCNGPAKLTQALRIDKTLNGVDLCARDGGIWLEAGERLDPKRIGRSPRIGVDFAPEPWRSKPWRFYIKDSPFISK